MLMTLLAENANNLQAWIIKIKHREKNRAQIKYLKRLTGPGASHSIDNEDIKVVDNFCFLESQLSIPFWNQY